MYYKASALHQFATFTIFTTSALVLKFSAFLLKFWVFYPKFRLKRSFFLFCPHRYIVLYNFYCAYCVWTVLHVFNTLPTYAPSLLLYLLQAAVLCSFFVKRRAPPTLLDGSHWDLWIFSVSETIRIEVVLQWHERHVYSAQKLGMEWAKWPKKGSNFQNEGQINQIDLRGG